MADYINVDIDWKEVKKKIKEALGTTSNAKMHAVLRMALNETVKGGKTEAGRSALKRYRIDDKERRKEVRDLIKTKKATSQNLTAVVITRGRPLALTRYYYKENNKNTTAFANVKKGSSGGLTGGFVATMDSGHVGIFKRYGNFQHRTKSKRKYMQDRAKSKKGIQQIKQLFGPGTSQMLASDEVTPEVVKEIEKRFDKALDRAINRVLAKG